MVLRSIEVVRIVRLLVQFFMVVTQYRVHADL
jgi:hypothetical protein